MTAALTLTKTTPRSWLQAGERLAVRNAPTSHGRVSFNISSALTGEKPAVTVLATTCDRVAFGCVFTWLRFHIPVTAVQASIAIDAPAGHAPSTPLSSVELRLRAPLGWEPTALLDAPIEVPPHAVRRSREATPKEAPKQGPSGLTSGRTSGRSTASAPRKRVLES